MKLRTELATSVHTSVIWISYSGVCFVFRISSFVLRIFALPGGSPDDVRVGGVEHSDAAAVELEDQALFGVHADAVAGELPSIV